MSDTFRSGCFVSATSTEVGKTVVSRALARALRLRGRQVAAIKPLETGCQPDPLDALALARACGRPPLAHAPGLYRAGPPLSPRAITLRGAAPPPEPQALATAILNAAAEHDFLLVEGAGGLRVPLGPDHDIADIARVLHLPLLLVAPDRLGVLSHVLTACDSAASRQLRVAAVILNPPTAPSEDDDSADDNHLILAERLDTPVLRFPHVPDVEDDDALAAVVPEALLASLGT